MEVLEIGSGHGIISCCLVKNAIEYISQHAIENTAINIKINKLDNIETRQSDVYSNISEKFDFIFWNIPWGSVPDEFKKNMTQEELELFDPGYNTILRYIIEGKNYLKPRGSL